MRLTALAATLLTVACRGTEPTPLGPLDSRITDNEEQAVSAAVSPERVIGQVFRNPLTGKFMQQRPALWERVLLPPLAHALQTLGIVGQPNATYCIENDPAQVLVPRVDCINTDAEGNARWDFLPTTKAGTHIAIASATIGLERTAPDTITLVVEPLEPEGDYVNDGVSMRASPATLLPTHVTDRYENPAPYRISGDDRLTPGDTVLGSEGARTVRFDSAGVDSTWRMVAVTGRSGAIARMAYRLVFGVQGIGGNNVEGPRIQAVICGLDVDPCVSETWQDP